MSNKADSSKAEDNVKAGRPPRKTFEHIPTRARPALGSGNYSSLGTVSSSRLLEGAMIVPLTQLVPNFQQVRQYFDSEALAELAEDIKARGIMSPLVVRELADDPGTYEIVAGERRYRAAILAGLSEVPVIIRKMDDRAARFSMLAENLQRADLDPRDEKRFFEALQAEYNLSITGIAELINKSRPYVQRRLNSELVDMQPPVLSQNGKPLDANRTLSEKDNEMHGANVLLNFAQSEVETVGKVENALSVKAKRSQSTPVRNYYNPKVYRRVSSFFDDTLSLVKSRPDEQTLSQIRESIDDAEQKLALLKQELENLKALPSLPLCKLLN